MSNRLTAKIKRADALFQQAAGIMWKYNCVRCKVQSFVGSGHHLWRRRRKDVRWALLNATWVCPRCHAFIHADSTVEQEFHAMLARAWPNLWRFHMEHSIPEDLVLTNAYIDCHIETLSSFIQSQGRHVGEVAS